MLPAPAHGGPQPSRERPCHGEPHQSDHERHRPRRLVHGGGARERLLETIQASAHLEAANQRVSGGNNPVDPKKTTISAEVSESGLFEAGKNGNVVGTLVPSLREGPTSGASIAVPGTLSTGEKIGRGKK